MPRLDNNPLSNPLGKGKTQRKRKKLGTDKFYNSTRWRGLSKSFLRRNPLCKICGDLAEHTDHITPWQLGGSKYSEKNLQSLCKPCHSRKTIKETRSKKI